MSKPTWILAISAAALALASPLLLGGAGSATAPETARRTVSASPAPARPADRPELVARPARVPQPRSPMDGPRAIPRAEAEQAFQEALEAAALVAESVDAHDAPPPSLRERGELRRQAVLAFVDLAPHLDDGARASQHAAMRAALGRLEALQPHFEDDHASHR